MLKWARDRFNGVVDNLRSHLLDTNKPQVPHLSNGYADWEEFGFNSLAVEVAKWRGGTLELWLSVRDPASARDGLKKYRRTWERSLREWLDCEVEVNFQDAKSRP
jgi:hypothetical protein